MNIFLIMCVVVFTSCTPVQKEEHVEITLMHGWGGSTGDHIEMQTIYADFEKISPSVTIAFDSSPDITVVIEKAIDMLAVDKIPDIISTNGMGNNFLQSAIKKKLALNLAPYVAQDSELRLNIPSELVQAADMTGELYSIPDVYEVQGLWYNKDILKRSGFFPDEKNPDEYMFSSWNSFFQLCEAIQNYAQKSGSDIYPFALQRQQYLSLLGVLLSSSHADIPIPSCFYEKENIIHCLNLLQYVASFSFPDFWNASINDARQLFIEGKTVFYFNGVWDSLVLSDSSIISDIAYAPYPSFSGESIAYKSIPTGYVIGNTNDPKRIEASIAFLKYMLSTNVQERIAYKTLQVPLNPHIDRTSLSKVNYVFSEALEKSYNADIHINILHMYWKEEIIAQLYDNLGSLLCGTLSAESFVDTIARMDTAFK